MKPYQEYDFQRIATQNMDNQGLPNMNNNSCNLRISLLEQRIDGLEKKLLYYEELVSIQDNELNKYQEHSNLINETLKRIAEIEESFVQLQSRSKYSLQDINIDNIIEGKLNLHQILIDTKLNDLSIMMQDLSQYNVNQQKQYSNTQDILSLFNEKINNHSLKIKELNKQMKLFQKVFDESNNSQDEEELFIKNIQRK